MRPATSSKRTRIARGGFLVMSSSMGISSTECGCNTLAIVRARRGLAAPTACAAACAKSAPLCRAPDGSADYGRAQLVAEVRMCELDQRPRARAIPQRRNVDDAVLRGDPLRVVPRGGDGHVSAEPRDDRRTAASTHLYRRAKADDAHAVRRLAGSHHE